MLKTYIKFAIRNFKSNKIIFIGNTLTICLGALCISMLLLYLINELTRNDFHKREKDIYLTVVKSSPESRWENTSPNVFFGFDYKEYPEIETATTVTKYNNGDIIIKNELKSTQPEGLIVDSTFSQVFDFDLKVGNEDKVLYDPDAILLTENLAKKLFGSENPIGEIVTVSAYMADDYIVRGIIDKIPSNSSLSFDFIIPNSYVPNQYALSGIQFLLMHKEFDPESFSKKIEHLGDAHDQFKGSILGIVPFESAYFNELNIDFGNIFSAYGDKKILYVLVIILFIILTITIFNISNLQIIHTNTSVKFIVLSIINGAEKRHILYQKLVESGLLVLFSTLLISCIQSLLIPFYSRFIHVDLTPGLGNIIVLNLCIVIILTLFAMVYPVLIAMKIPIIYSLKNQAFITSKLIGKKPALVIQYTLTFILLISSVVVIRQLNMMLEKDLGFNSQNIIKTKMFYEIPSPVELFIPRDATHENRKIMDTMFEKWKAKQDQQKRRYEYIKDEFRKNPVISNFSHGNSPLDTHKMPWTLKGKESEYSNQNTLGVKPEYSKIFGFEILEGRFFDLERDKGNDKRIVINEAAKKYWKINDISTTRLQNKYWGYDSPEGYEIIGVIKDFNYERLTARPEPLAMVHLGSRVDDNFLIQFVPGKVDQGLSFVKELFQKENPNASFQYSFLEDEINKMYEKEKQLSIIYIIFTAIALLISSIGLFTIALYDTRRRLKEIGVRKVNGASAYEILIMFGKDFSKYILWAFIIACPITYMMMQQWLGNFAYKTDISWWIFAFAGTFILFIALFTVSWHSYKAANLNPVEVLKDE